MRICWEANLEKLLCLVVLDDAYARTLDPRANTAFFRAFIVQDRATGAVRMKFRFRYLPPKGREWFRVESQLRDVKLAVSDFRSGIKFILEQSAYAAGTPLPVDAIGYFTPPDDGGDPMLALAWLENNGLIQITEELTLDQARERGLID